MKWIGTSQLEHWACLPTSGAELPKIISDLIRATSPGISAMRFPSGDKGQVRGFDGHLESSYEGLNVPEGVSIWEFGTDRDYKAKAFRDFRKRSNEVDVEVRKVTTYVFVSPWTWDSSKSDNKVEDWIEAAYKEYAWKKILYIDGVSLEMWLETCPAVSAYHAKNTLHCAPVDGVRSTDEFWREFADRYDPKVTEDVLLCERERDTATLLEALMGQQGSISISADTSDEVIAFAVASIRKAQPEVRLFLEARTLIIDKMSAGRALIHQKNLIYFLRDEAAKTPGQFSERGPTLVSLGRQRNLQGIILNRPSAFAMGEAMKTMGYEDHKALTMARGCGRSLAALARQIPGGSSEPPEWFGLAVQVLPAIFAGAWDANNSLDQAVLEQLSGKKAYHDYEASLRHFLQMADPPLDREGTVWKVRAPLDAFIHVGHLIGSEHLVLLRDVMTTVFSHVLPDPGPDEVVSFYKPAGPVYSDWLKDGLATILLMIAVWDKQADLNLGAGVGQNFANDLVSNLPGLMDNHRLISSLADQLPLLAEAAPNPFLKALEQMLEGDASVIRPIFVEPEGFFPSRTQHTGLLWALETLAWDPLYFHRAVHILAKLAAIDPGGKVSNRPQNSLKEIFLLWSPCTNASSSQRSAALNVIVRDAPVVGWDLILSLLSSTQSVSITTSKPRLRESGKSNKLELTYKVLWDNQAEVAEMAIRLAGSEIDRWISLIPKIHQFPELSFKNAIDGLNSAMTSLNSLHKQSLWLKLRGEVNKHERFNSAKWAMPAPQLEALKELINKHASEDPVSSIVWLFNSWMIDGTEEAVQIDAQRILAVRNLYDVYGPEAVIRLGKESKLSYELLKVLQAALTLSEVKRILDQGFTYEFISDFSISLAGLYRYMGGEKVAVEWMDNAAVIAKRANVLERILMTWPDQKSTWDFVKRQGKNVEKVYWTSKGPTWMQGTKRELLYATLMFLKYGCAFSALRTALYRTDEVPSRLIVKILQKLLVELSSESPPNDSMVSYSIEKAFEDLDQRNDVDVSTITQLEFPYLQIIQDGSRKLRIHELMSKSPKIYHDVLSAVFRADGDPKEELSESQALYVKNCYALLREFKILPGLNADSLSSEVLTDWINQVRRLGASSKRAEITDSYVGHILAHSPLDADGAWPHQVIRDQIESLQSTDIEQGIQTERYNMRGVTSRGMYDGGTLERELSVQYQAWAEICKNWPRTHTLLLALSQSWEQDAQRQDLSARQRKLQG